MLLFHYSASYKTLFRTNLECTYSWRFIKQAIFHHATEENATKCYKILKKTLALPGISKLKSYLKRVDIKPGFHENIFDALTCKSEHPRSFMDISSKSIAQSFEWVLMSYDVSNDNVCGVEDFGTGGTTWYVANHAGVFMVRVS